MPSIFKAHSSFSLPDAITDTVRQYPGIDAGFAVGMAQRAGKSMAISTGLRDTVCAILHFLKHDFNDGVSTGPSDSNDEKQNQHWYSE